MRIFSTLHANNFNYIRKNNQTVPLNPTNPSWKKTLAAVRTDAQESDDHPWLVYHNSKLYEPGDEEFLFMHKDHESLQVKDGETMGKLKMASTIKHWLAAGLEKKHAVILRSVTNDVLRTGMYVSTCVAGEDTNDYHTLRAVQGKMATLLVEHWTEEINKLPEKEKTEAKEEYEQLLSYVKPADAPEPKNSKNWKESTTWDLDGPPRSSRTSRRSARARTLTRSLARARRRRRSPSSPAWRAGCTAPRPR